MGGFDARLIECSELNFLSNSIKSSFLPWNSGVATGAQSWKMVKKVIKVAPTRTPLEKSQFFFHFFLIFSIPVPTPYSACRYDVGKYEKPYFLWIRYSILMSEFVCLWLCASNVFVRNDVTAPRSLLGAGVQWYRECSLFFSTLCCSVCGGTAFIQMMMMMMLMLMQLPPLLSLYFVVVSCFFFWRLSQRWVNVY